MSDVTELRVAVADDEPLARAALRSLLALETDVALVAECATGREAIEATRRHGPHILFLDIQMPELDGLGVLERLPSTDRPVVVCTTAHAQYALQAFEEDVADYLLKPFDPPRFRKALDRARERVRTRELAALVRNGAGVPAQRPEFVSRLAVRVKRGTEFVPVDQIRWIQAADQYVRVHTAQGEHLLRESLADLDTSLDPAVFFRTHRSAIVALDAVQRLEVEASGTGRVLVDGGTWVPVSRPRLRPLRERLS